ncbi:RrF2 family transcriptional regulator [Exiguobacterium acetylicum]|uniref:RrF2 family transcriptional regulator n=1 Tax=Exiguobacterium acetylicum TaxID=41170 RepID=UPI001EE31DE1|nr:Rrf2 family transcriptional regulator [Exiguobacterium acetylicum]UKS57420.1 Rrf2 family transcriptional regulator [Exiguobacterium acetylicum]
MRLKRATEHGLLTLLFLVHTSKSMARRGEYVKTRDISLQCDISYEHLTKTVSILRKAGLLQTHAGREGGVQLLPLSHTVRVGDVVALFERPFFPGTRYQVRALDHLLDAALISFFNTLNQVTIKQLADDLPPHFFLDIS